MAGQEGARADGWAGQAGSTPQLPCAPSRSCFLSDSVWGNGGAERGLGKGDPRSVRGGGVRLIQVRGWRGGVFVEGQAGSRRGSGVRRPARSRREGRGAGAARVCAVGEKIPLLPTDRARG